MPTYESDTIIETKDNDGNQIIHYPITLDQNVLLSDAVKELAGIADTGENAMDGFIAILSIIAKHKNDKNNPHGVTPYQIGAAGNPNLLDNWYFKGPINQRGFSGTISTAGYFIDRWKLVSGTVQITSGGIVLNGKIQQIIENRIGTDVIASVLTDSGLISGAYDDSTNTYSITATGQKIVAAKLEIGTKQTLARQENGVWMLNDAPPNKQQELAKCQRYYAYYGTCANGYGTTYSRQGENVVYILLPISVPMRKKPSAIYAASNVSNVIVAGSNRYAITSVEVTNIYNNIVQLKLGFDGTIPAATHIMAQVVNLELSADL